MAFREKVRCISITWKAKKTFFLTDKESSNHLEWVKVKERIVKAILDKNYNDFLQSVELFKSLNHSAPERLWYIENIYMKMAPDFLAHQPDIVNLMQNDSQFFNARPTVAQHCFDLFVTKLQ